MSAFGIAIVWLFQLCGTDSITAMNGWAACPAWE